MLRKFLFPFILLIASPVLADEPMLPPAVWQTCSPNGVYCATLDPGADRITVYRAGAADNVLWSAAGWSRVAALADDGEHLVLGYEGMNLIPVDYEPDMEMLTFYRRDAVIQRVALSVLVDRKALQRTVSHWYWGDYLGLDANGRYTVRTAGSREIRFDMTTGLPVR